jgi:hypothetical protein
MGGGAGAGGSMAGVPGAAGMGAAIGVGKAGGNAGAVAAAGTGTVGTNAGGAGDGAAGCSERVRSSCVKPPAAGGADETGGGARIGSGALVSVS